MALPAGSVRWAAAVGAVAVGAGAAVEAAAEAEAEAAVGGSGGCEEVAMKSRSAQNSCESPPPEGASGASHPAGWRDPTNEAQGVPAPPAALPLAAAPPVASAAAVPAGLRWTADEGGTYGMHDPTMTFCTKEAWGDIMSMFSGGLASEGEAEVGTDQRLTLVHNSGSP